MKRYMLLFIMTLAVSPLFGQQAMALAEQLEWAAPAEGKRIIATLTEAGEPAVHELIAALSEANDRKTNLASFALDGLTRHVTRPGAEAERKALAHALATGLPLAADDVAANVILQELQYCGTDAEIPALEAQLTLEKRRPYAIRAITAIGTPAAVTVIVNAVAKVDAAARLDYVTAVTTLRAKAAAPALMETLKAVPPHRRPAVMHALAVCAHEPAAELLFDALKSTVKTERDGARAALVNLAVNLKSEKPEAAAQLAYRHLQAESSEAALRAVTLCCSETDAIPLLTNTILPGDAVLRNAALNQLQELQGDRATRAAIVLLKTGRDNSDMLTDVLDMLGRRGDKAAWADIAALAAHENADVRLHAIGALVQLDAAQAMPLLVEAMKQADATTANALMNLLKSLNTNVLHKQLADILPTATPHGQAAICELFASRNVADANSLMLPLVTAKESAVRKAALKALEVTVTPQDLPALLTVLPKMEKAADQRGIQAVLTALATKDAEAAAVLVDAVKTQDGAAHRILLALMPRIGTDAAFDALTADLDNADADMRTAAVRSLADWPNQKATPLLKTWAGRQDEPVNRVLALRGLVRLAAQDDGRTLPSRAEALADAAALCTEPDERKLVLGSLNTLHVDAALEKLVLPALDDEELVPEATQAALQIVAQDGTGRLLCTSSTARTTLRKVLTVCKDEALAAQAKSLLERMPPHGINLAIGKPVTTTCAHEDNHTPDKAVDGIIDKDNNAWFGVPYPCSITVDLEQEEDISAVRPIFYWDETRYYAYTVEISTDGKTWTQIVDASDNTAVATEDGIRHLLIPSVRARHVRLNILKNSANTSVHLVELEVYSETATARPAQGPNLLLRQPVTAASPQEQHFSPDRVTDGKIGKWDGWHTDVCPTWVKVDMQQTALIDTIRVIFFWDETRTYSYNIEVSEDDKNWTKVADVPDNPDVSEAYGFVHTFDPVKARYVRLNVTKGVMGRYVHVVELEAYAAGKAPQVLPSAEPRKVNLPPLPEADADGFRNLFNGKDLYGWGGSVNGYGVKDGGIMYCNPKIGGYIYTIWQFADFVLDFEFKLDEAANNGLAIRAPTEGDAAYVGMELQIIDNEGYKARTNGALAPWQHHGSVYGVVPAKQGALKKAGEWNHQVVTAIGPHVKVVLNDQVITDTDLSKITETADGKGLDVHKGIRRRFGHIGWLGHGDYVEFRNIRIKELEPYEQGPFNIPPEGFHNLFNGKDLDGWKGLVANPEVRAQMTAEQLAEAQKAADADMRAHWHVVDGMLEFDGKGQALCTAKDYRNFELLVDWKISAGGDSGIYLRGSPQVQIWDAVQWKIGSGGLYNNEKNPSQPSWTMDNPVGKWNRFKIRMVDDKVSVWLNGTQVVDNVVMENYWNRAIPIYPKGQIELQNHNSRLWFRNVFIRELED